MPRRVVNFAGQCAAIEYQTAADGEIVEFLFGGLSDTEVHRPRAEFRLTREDGDGQLSLDIDGRRLWSGERREDLAMVLMAEVTRQLTLHNTTGTAFHSAALSRRGHGLLLPGQSGAGKSSLTAWLACNGFDYLSDELSFIAAGSFTIEAFTRPINIKHRGLQAVCDALDFDPACGWHSDLCVLIPPSCLQTDNQRQPAELELLLFPRFQPGSRLLLTKLSKARAGLLLMECLINARILDGHGFGETARIARHVPAYSLEYGHFDQLQGDEMRMLLERFTASHEDRR